MTYINTLQINVEKGVVIDRVSIVVKYTCQKQSGDERLYFSLCFYLTVHHSKEVRTGTQQRRNLKAGLDLEAMEE